MAEQAEAVRIRQLDLTEALAVNPRNPVMLREPLVDERVVGAQQLQRAAVVAQDVAEKHLGLASKTLADVVIEVREHQQVGRDLRLEVAELQPLAGEVADKSVRTFVRDHPLHLGREHTGLAEPT